MVEDKQLTAVSFLIKALSDKIAFTPGSELDLWHAQLYEQALAMEREQFITVAMYHKCSTVSPACIESYLNKNYSND
jgi:hypothetical protein